MSFDDIQCMLQTLYVCCSYDSLSRLCLMANVIHLGASVETFWAHPSYFSCTSDTSPALCTLILFFPCWESNFSCWKQGEAQLYMIECSKMPHWHLARNAFDQPQLLPCSASFFLQSAGASILWLWWQIHNQ